MTDAPKPLRVHRQHPESGVAAVMYAQGAWATLWPIGVRDAFVYDELSPQERADRFQRCVDIKGAAAPTDEQWGRLMATWAALTDAAHDEPEEEHRAVVDAQQEIGLALAQAVRAGHSRADMLEVQQEGSPYRGWTLLQLRYWARHGRRVLDREEARLLAIVNEAMAPFHVKDSKGAAQRLSARVRALQSSRD